MNFLCVVGFCVAPGPGYPKLRLGWAIQSCAQPSCAWAGLSKVAPAPGYPKSHPAQLRLGWAIQISISRRRDTHFGWWVGGWAWRFLSCAWAGLSKVAPGPGYPKLRPAQLRLGWAFQSCACAGLSKVAPSPVAPGPGYPKLRLGRAIQSCALGWAIQSGPDLVVFGTFWPRRLQGQILGSGSPSPKRCFLIQKSVRFDTFWTRRLQGQILGFGPSPKRCFLTLREFVLTHVILTPGACGRYRLTD